MEPLELITVQVRLFTLQLSGSLRENGVCMAKHPHQHQHRVVGSDAATV